MPVSGANRVRRGCIATLVSALIGAHGCLLAAEPTVPGTAHTRPRIGLALSGGGARGIAHVGVLKVLDEMRIPISCITGTSMGSIVGGTFAAGRTPAELEKIVLAANWEEIFRDKPPRDEISIRRKSEDYMTLFAPEYGVKNGSLALPKGVIAGVSIEAFFRQLAEPAVGVDNFDKLPIPFEAMATDIENGESVVLDHGSLSQAMRASMAVPGAIAPVEIDGKLLVDGGIANNLPIDQARKLCGDVVIAVNISTPPLKRDEITSALSVAAQLLNFLGKQTVDQQLKSLGSGDVLIEPDLGNISAASFADSKEAIRIGEAATRALAPALARYSLPPEQYAALRARQVAHEKPLGTVSEIRFAGLDRTNPDVLRGLVKSKPGEPLEEQKVGADLRRIYGRGDFESIEYHIEDGAGPRAMVITPHEKSWGPDYLRFGLGLETDFQGDNEFNILVRYRKTWLNRLGAEWVTEAQVGQDTHLYTEFFQPLHEAGVWFGSVYGKVGQQTRGLFVGDDKVADYRVSYAGGGLDVGAVLGTTGMLRVGPLWNQVKAEVETGDPFLPTISELTAGGRVALALDQLDHAWFPRAGYRAVASYYGATESLGSALNYQRLEGTLSYVKSFGPHTLNLAAAGGTDFETDMPAYESFWLGGPLRLSGFRVGQFTGREYFFGRAMYYNRVLPLPDLLGSGLYLGGSAEIGRIVDRVDGLDSPGTLYSGSVFLGADTFIGPAYLGVGAGSGGSYSVYLLIGAP
jgi:NTE family protein